MSYILATILAAVCLLFFFGWMFVAMARKKKNILLYPVIGTFLAGFFLLLPIAVAPEENSWFHGVLVALHDAVQLFTVDSDFGTIQEVREAAGALYPFYAGFSAVLYVLAPLLTAGFLLSFFRDFAARTRWLLNYFRPVYVFSDLNEEAVTLAESLAAGKRTGELSAGEPEQAGGRKKAPVFVFMNADTEDEDDLYPRAQAIGGILFRSKLSSSRLFLSGTSKNRGTGNCHHSKKAPITFLVMNTTPAGDDFDDGTNIDLTLRLVETYRRRSNTRIYLFSDSVESELLLSGIEKGQVKLRRVNVIQSLIRHTLSRHGTKIFDHALPIGPQGEKQIHAVIVGLGKHGCEMMRQLAWYGQMTGYRLHIDCFEKKTGVRSRLEGLYPGLMADGGCRHGAPLGEPEEDADYTITVHEGCDVNSREFARILQSMPAVTYVLVALGEDERNMIAAVRLRTLCEQMHWHPFLQAIRYGTYDEKAFANAKTYRKEAYDMDLVGDRKSLYSAATLFEDTLEAEGLRRHCEWGSQEDFFRYEYNYNSSIASALHVYARRHCDIPGARKTSEERTPEEKNILRRLEHRRWTAYMYAEGYVFAPEKSALAKHHCDLIRFSDLSLKEKEKDDSDL